MASYNVTGAVIYSPRLTEIVKNGSPVVLTADLSGYELWDEYGNGGGVYFPSEYDEKTQFGEEFTVTCFSGAQGGGTVLAQLKPVLTKISSRRASLTFTPPLGTRSIRVDDRFYTLVGKDTFDYTNSGGYVYWGAANTYEYGAYYWAAEDPITHAGAPGTPQLQKSMSREGVTLTWSAGADGTGNSVTGYDVEQSDSADGLAWGAWQTAPGTPATGTSATVYPPAAAGYYRRFRVRTRGTAGGDWYSGWVQSAGALRRKWDAFGAWTDAALTAGVSGIRAVHLTQLQERVNVIRAFYGLQAFVFTPVAARKTKIAKWAQLISEIRTAIDQITTEHEAYNTLREGRPKIANVTQLRRIIDEM